MAAREVPATVFHLTDVFFFLLTFQSLFHDTIDLISRRFDSGVCMVVQTA